MVDIVALRGGLGNQLFCWALGVERATSGNRVFYDVGTVGRMFGLERLVWPRQRIALPGRLWRWASRHEIQNPIVKINVENQSRAPHEQRISSGLVTLHWGYWQSERYFSESAAHVRSKLLEWLRIDAVDKSRCAIHVRRGDYVTDPGAAQTMGALSLDYYMRAVEHMKSAGFRRFVVVSDDLPSAKAILGNLVPDAEFASGVSAEDDFRTIASSGGVVTANSSFSWWAAYAAAGAGATIASPRKWFADTSLLSQHVTPPSWDRI